MWEASAWSVSPRGAAVCSLSPALDDKSVKQTRLRAEAPPVPSGSFQRMQSVCPHPEGAPGIAGNHSPSLIWWGRLDQSR